MERKATATWYGDLTNGSGHARGESDAFQVNFNFRTRFENEPGTNPEELIGAAHAGCFSMALSNILKQAGFSSEKIQTNASVKLEQSDAGFAITEIHLVTRASVPGISNEEFVKNADLAKVNCPVSKALAGVKITLDAAIDNSIKDM
ncbi:MAG: OsmC family protein [Chloroflexota bacterium]